MSVTESASSDKSVLLYSWFAMLLFVLVLRVGLIVDDFFGCSNSEVTPLEVASDTERESDVGIAKVLIQKLNETARPYTSSKGPKKEKQEKGDIEEGRESSKDGDRIESRPMSNACAICLEEFEDGETVVRSTATKECQHIFHESCMEMVVHAAVKRDEYSVPCPCCRQTFVNIFVLSRLDTSG